MVEEIDLRPYIRILLRQWKWIVGLAVGAAIIGFTISSLQPATYQASALVLITEPRYQIQFDARLRTEDATPIYRAFPRLAMSDDVLEEVIDALASSPGAQTKEWDLTALSEMLTVSSEDDRNLVVLEATARSAEDAAAVANQWADVFVEHGNKAFSEGEGDVAFFTAQLEQAEQALNNADIALIEFEARNQASIVNAQLNSVIQSQADYLAEQRGIAYIMQDIQGLRKQLEGQQGEQSLSMADYLTALLLQVKAFNAQGPTVIELGPNSKEALSDKSLTEQIAFLDNLMEVLAAKSSEIDEHLAELEPLVLTLQRQRQEFILESDGLYRILDLARETYTTLARKVDEAQIAAQEENKMFRVGSYARAPRFPIRRQRPLKTGAAGVLGLVVGVAVAFLIEFWRRDGRQTKG